MNDRFSGILLITLNLFLFQYFPCFGQATEDSRRDYTWYLSNFSASAHVNLLDFSTTPFTLLEQSTQLNSWRSCSNICDTMGRPLFATNGWDVSDSTNQFMPNGDSLSRGAYFDVYYNTVAGNPINQSVLSLPVPGSGKDYIIFHQSSAINPLWQSPYFIFPGMLYSRVDMSLRGGLGDVTEKNQVIIRDSMHAGMFTATRHANGRDWWILAPRANRPIYDRILLSPEGMEVLVQTVPALQANIEPETGGAVFTPDGSKYIRCSENDVTIPFRLEVYDFDRCSGELSNYLNLTGICDPAVSSVNPPSVAVSPNSRFLYVQDVWKIYQFDLQATDVAASAQVIGTWDSAYWYNTPVAFSSMQLAPDGKIYLGADCTPYLHVINYPDLPGTACGLQKQAVLCFNQNDSGLPNFPNFRLGRLEGSLCDTLYNSVEETAVVFEKKLEIYPNPAGSTVNIKVKGMKSGMGAELLIINEMGQIVDRLGNITGRGAISYSTALLSEGSYTVLLTDGINHLCNTRLVVTK